MKGLISALLLILFTFGIFSFKVRSKIKTISCEIHLKLFRDTNVFLLAKAVCREDLKAIEKFIINHPNLIDFQEPTFGLTVLMMAVEQDLKKSTEKLLILGADPNLGDDYNGTSSIIRASGFGRNFDTDTTILQLLLKYNGDPNSVETGERPEGNTTRHTALQKAAGCCIKKVKILVEAGADINYRNEFNGSALYAALVSSNKDSPEILKYLLIEKKADFNKPLYHTIDGTPKYIEHALRTWRYPLESKQYKIKMEIVQFLYENGRDYWGTKIPKKFWNLHSKEYLMKY